MKTIAKDNIKKIRKENTKGNFSTVKNSILEDNRLSASARLLLINVFAKSDDFAYSESYIINFLNVTHKTYYKIREELIQFGYLKINTNVKMKSQNYYIFSEFGNLNTQPEEKEVVVNKVEPIKSEEPKVDLEPKDELCTIEDMEKLGFDKKISDIVDEIIKEGYNVNVANFLDFLLQNVTKKQLEKGFNYDKIKKRIVERFSTKLEKITDKELEEMIITKGTGLTKDEKKSVLISIKKRIEENPDWTITDISAKILVLITDVLTVKTRNLNQYYQN
jgi:hypothetical protein